MEDLQGQKNNSGGVRTPVKEDQIHKLLVPPGFVSHTAFTLKRMSSSEDAENSTAFANESDSTPVSSHVFSSLDDDALEANLKIKYRPWILHDHFDHNEEKSDVEQSHENVASEGCLPEGVIRGCSECSNCLKVSAQWDPKGGCSPILEEAPVFQPTHEEFNETFKYIESICQQVKPYGFCRIIPPPSWQPPCFLGENNAWQSFKFTTEVQRISEFQNHFSKRKGLASENAEKSKRRRISKLSFDNESGNGYMENHEVDGFLGVEQLQFQSGPLFTLESFKKNADSFKECYFPPKSKLMNPEACPITSHEHWEHSEEDIEGEYWRILEKPTAEIEVLCGANLDARRLQSKFPEYFKTEEASNSSSYPDSGWNLNNISSLAGSLLAFENLDNLGDLAPQFHIGMCFSCRPWEVEEHHLYTLYYLHLGAPKIWYGAPGHCFQKFEAVVKKHFPLKFTQCPELLHEQVMQISPATILAEGIPAYRCIQQPKEFVLFLPGAYHAGFDCGFNVSESSCFAPLDWLPHGQSATEIYREKRKKPLISYDKLLLRAAHEAVKAQWEILLKGRKTPSNLRWKNACGKGGIIAKTLRRRVQSEAQQREYLCSDSQWRKMDKSFDEGARKECWICHFYLYLSASFCPCNPNRYSCLKHTKHLCSCAWSEKVFLFRFTVSELNLLAEAIEGKFSAVHRWVKENHGEALEYDTSNGSAKDILQDSSSANKPLEHKGETESSSDLGTNRKDATKKLVSESMARILKASSLDDPKMKSFASFASSTSGDSSDDSSSESDEERLFSFFRQKDQKSIPSASPSASCMRVSTEQPLEKSKTGLRNKKGNCQASPKM